MLKYAKISGRRLWGLMSPYLFLLFIFIVIASNGANAKTIFITPKDNIEKTINNAKNGDVISLGKGIYKENIKINKSITLTSTKKYEAIIDGSNKSSVIRVTAPNVTIKNLTIKNSGSIVEDEDAGIYMAQTATSGIIKNNHIIDNIFGISLHGSSSVHVFDNFIKGSQNPHWAERGDGIRMWNVHNSLIENNEFKYGRDGIFLNTSTNNILRGNLLHDLRFAIHYMYDNYNKVVNNKSYNNHIGYALMFSNGIQAIGNVSLNDRDYGIMFNFANKSIIKNNSIKNTKDKCAFLYNSNNNIIKDNYFAGCNIGIHYTAGSKNNHISGNAFISNRHQVKYVGTQYREWSENGRGNYWSDNTGFDLNKDGISDSVYRPNNISDKIMWKFPIAKLLFASPAMKALKWAQEQFPTILPGGITDSYPLISYKTPANLKALEKLEAAL